MAETREAVDPVSGQTVLIRNDLVDRLRGKYACGPTLQNGEPEFGYREFGAVPIQIEAADEIERLRAERDHWYGLVSRADIVQFPFQPQTK